MRALIALLFAVVLAATGPTSAEQLVGKRVALVIGNSEYRNVDRLPNGANDARLIAKTLKDLDFTLLGGGPQVDLDRAHLSAAVQEFGRALAGAEVGLFYYSGHGLQVGGVNWLVPVDANPSRPQDLDFQMVDADLVLRQMDGAGTKLNLVLLDACRNNPFGSRGFRAVQGGLAEMRAPEGTLISYATQPGNVAADGGGANSPYTTALASSMRQPGLDIFRMFNQVGLLVKRNTDGSQQPWVSNSPIDGDFFFTAAPPPPASTAPETPVRPKMVMPWEISDDPPTTGSGTPIVRSSDAPTPASPTTEATSPAPTQMAGLLGPPGNSKELLELLLPRAGGSSENGLRTLARALRCSVLDATTNGETVDVAGLALPGTAWEGFIQRVRSSSGTRTVNVRVDFMPPQGCAVLDVLGAAMVSARPSAARMLTLSPREAGAGENVMAELHGTVGASVLLDVFRMDGSVEHVPLYAPAHQGGDWQVPVTRALGMAAGTELVTVVVAQTPIAMASRPTVERAEPYLEALRQALAGQAGLRADAARVDVRAAQRALRPVGGVSVGGGRCAGIVARARLGQPLSDTDSLVLRTLCR